MNFPFSRKKGQIDALRMLERSVAVELRTFTNHLQSVIMAFEVLRKQNEEIITLLKEKKQDE